MDFRGFLLVNDEHIFRFFNKICVELKKENMKFAKEVSFKIINKFVFCFQFTCAAVSSHCICIGGSTGSIYVFDRVTGKLIKFVSHQVM